jgi:hypothetical protein
LLVKTSQKLRPEIGLIFPEKSRFFWIFPEKGPFSGFFHPLQNQTFPERLFLTFS